MDWNRVATAAKTFFEEVKEAVEDKTEEAIEDAGKGVTGGGDAAAEIASEVRRGVEAIAAEVESGVARITKTVTEAVGTMVEDALSAAGGIDHAGAFEPEDPYTERLLTDGEKKLARDVFRDTLPYGAIWLSNGLGFGQRPYTIPHPLHIDSYVIHFGVAGFQDATDSSVQILGFRADVAFIHEMTHVWQGLYRSNPFDYVIDSLYNQIRWGAGAYDYTVSADSSWESFTAEQQAHIVHDWYEGGMSETDERFRFIRDNIRTGTL